VVYFAQIREQPRDEFRSRILSHKVDKEHATLDRISIVADNLNAATVKAKSLFDTLDMPQKTGRVAHLGSGEARIVRFGSGCP
jgi:hypothetical protein